MQKARKYTLLGSSVLGSGKVAVTIVGWPTTVGRRLETSTESTTLTGASLWKTNADIVGGVPARLRVRLRVKLSMP
jgi:hypothetical protein